MTERTTENARLNVEVQATIRNLVRREAIRGSTRQLTSVTIGTPWRIAIAKEIRVGIDQGHRAEIGITVETSVERVETDTAIGRG